jgi:membrane-bound lytic murein transglycosylase B
MNDKAISSSDIIKAPLSALRVMALLLCSFLLLGCAHADYNGQKKNFTNNPDVKLFIQHMVNKHHFNKPELIALFKSVKIRPKVIHNVKFPSELNPWYTYRTLYLTQARIKEGVEFWNKYQEALAKAENIYGVPANIIVATIGIESEYGQYTGKYPVIDALVNLAFGDTSRTAYFRQELEEFLLLTREQHLNPLKVMGSYAGAIGQPQFMPSSYRYYAVNFSGNSTIDLSHDEVDVIGSIANFYNLHGWRNDHPVAIPDLIGGGEFKKSLTKSDIITLSDLIAAGMIKDSRFLNDKKTRLVVLRGKYENEYWLTFHNFNVIKQYNPSDVYAMAVYQLSYYITASRGEQNHV